MMQSGQFYNLFINVSLAGELVVNYSPRSGTKFWSSEGALKIAICLCTKELNLL